jgi:hypothetical protein
VTSPMLKPPTTDPPAWPVPTWLTRTPWWLPSVVYAPLAAGGIALGALWQVTPWFTAPLFLIGGMVGWTVYEYVVHRYVFHAADGARGLVGFLKHSHDIHHALPDDPLRIVVHPILNSWAVAAVLGLHLVLGFLVGLPGELLLFFTGTLVMWLTYGVAHWWMHCGRPPRSKRLRALRVHHLRHHFQPGMDERAFGVSTRLWDRVFRTMPVEPGSQRPGH